MAKYSVTIHSKGLVADQDARFLSVRVRRDGENLGLFQARVDGLDLMALEKGGRATQAQRWRLVADELASVIRDHVTKGRLRTEWALDAEVIPIDVMRVQARDAGLVGSVPDFAEGDEVLSFEV